MLCFVSILQTRYKREHLIQPQATHPFGQTCIFTNSPNILTTVRIRARCSLRQAVAGADAAGRAARMRLQSSRSGHIAVSKTNDIRPAVSNSPQCQLSIRTAQMRSYDSAHAPRKKPCFPVRTEAPWCQRVLSHQSLVSHQPTGSGRLRLWRSTTRLASAAACVGVCHGVCRRRDGGDFWLALILCDDF